MVIFYKVSPIVTRLTASKWFLVAVYGAAQPEFKEEFLSELVHACGTAPLPILVGGDFNIIRNPGEKK